LAFGFWLLAFSFWLLALGISTNQPSLLVAEFLSLFSWFEMNSMLFLNSVYFTSLRNPRSNDRISWLFVLGFASTNQQINSSLICSLLICSGLRINKSTHQRINSSLICSLLICSGLRINKSTNQQLVDLFFVDLFRASPQQFVDLFFVLLLF